MALDRRSLGRTFALATLSALALAASCGGPRPTSIVVGGARIDRVEILARATSATGVAAIPGDWVMQSPKLRVVVGGLRRGIGERGAILEAESSETTEDESIGVLTPSVHVGRRRYAVDVTELAVHERRRRPVLRMDGRVLLADGTRLVVTRELAIDPDAAAISISTKVAPQQGALDVRLGARIAWGGADPWLPGLGPLHDDAWHDASFLGVEGENTGTVYGVRDAPLRVGAEYELHGAERFLRHTEAMGPVQSASPAVPASERALLVITPRGLARALRTFGWLRGVAFPESGVYLPYAPAGAEVRTATRDGKPLLHARPDAHGSVVVPLPPVVDHEQPAYVAYATAPGHAVSDPVVFSPGDRVRLEIPHGGRVRVIARDARSGERIPARIRFLPLEGTPPIELGPDWSADGAGDVVATSDGDAVVPTANGRYRVLVMHGPEWTLHDETVTVTETFRPDVRADLEHVIDPDGWVACDLHVHASPSPDSHVSLEDRVTSLVAEGIELAVPTDHNHITDYAPAALARHIPEGTFLTVPGVEVTTWEPHFGHFNAYPVVLDPNAPNNGAPPWEGLVPTDMFASMRALGPNVTIQVNHPRLEGEIGYFDMTGYDAATGNATGPYSANYDVLEVWNGFDLGREPEMRRVLDDWLHMVARGRHVVAVGNSDSHTVRFQTAGYPRTYVHTDDRDPTRIIDALRDGRAFVTDGPFLEASVGALGPGEVAAAENGVVHLHVRVRVPPWLSVEQLEVWEDAAKVVEQAITPPAPAPAPPHRPPHPAPPPAEPSVVALDATFDVEVHHDTGLVVLVRGTHPMDEFFGRLEIPPLAFTNPIWIDADGDGRGPQDPGDPAPRPGRWDAVVLDAGVDAGPDAGAPDAEADAAADAGGDAD